MKKFLALLFTVLLAVSLAACGETGKTSDSTEAVRTAADGFLTAVKAGDMEKAAEFTSGDVMDDFNMDQLDGMVDNFFEELEIDPSTVDASVSEKLNEFLDMIKQNFLVSYEITEVSAEGRKGTVKADLDLGFDIDEIKNTDLPADLEVIAQDYMEEHMDELIPLAGDQKALMNKVITDLAPVLLDKYSDMIFSANGTTEAATLTLEEKDGKWLVTNVTTKE